MSPGVLTGAGVGPRTVAYRDRAPVGPHRLHRVRRATGTRRAVSRAVRAPAPVADERAVRARDRRHQPAARSLLHATRDLLRLAPARLSRALLGGLCFILPGLVAIIALASVFCRRRCRRGSAARAWAPVRLSPPWRYVPERASQRRSRRDLRSASRPCPGARLWARRRDCRRAGWS